MIRYIEIEGKLNYTVCLKCFYLDNSGSFQLQIDLLVEHSVLDPERDLNTNKISAAINNGKKKSI